jgi:hypothetical protein
MLELMIRLSARITLWSLWLVTNLKHSHSAMEERLNEWNLSGEHNLLPMEYIFEHLYDVDLAQRALTCHEWHLIADRKWQARAKRNVIRWTSLQEDWEKQHAKWKAARAQLFEQDAEDLDMELRGPFNDRYRQFSGAIWEGKELAVLHRTVEELYERGATTLSLVHMNWTVGTWRTLRIIGFANKIVRRVRRQSADASCYGALAMYMIGCAGPPTPSKCRMYHTLVAAPAFLVFSTIGPSTTVLL